MTQKQTGCIVHQKSWKSGVLSPHAPWHTNGTLMKSQMMSMAGHYRSEQEWWNQAHSSPWASFSLSPCGRWWMSSTHSVSSLHICVWPSMCQLITLCNTGLSNVQLAWNSQMVSCFGSPSAVVLPLPLSLYPYTVLDWGQEIFLFPPQKAACFRYPELDFFFKQIGWSAWMRPTDALK